MTPTGDASASIAQIVDRFAGRQPTLADLEAAAILGYQAGFQAGRDAPPTVVKIGNTHRPEIES